MPDLKKTVSYRDFVANTPGEIKPISGIVADRVEMPSPDLIQFREKRSLQDGFDAGDPYLGSRQLTLYGTAYAPTRAEMFDLVQQIKAAFAPTLAFREEPSDKGFRPLLFSVITARTTDYPDGVIDLRVMAIPQALRIDPWDRKKHGGEDDQPLAVQWAATMYCRRPIIESKDPIVVEFPTTDGSAEKPVTGDAATNVLTATGHGLDDGDPIFFSRLVGGDPLTVGTRYFVRDKTTDTFKLTASPGGIAIDFTVDITSAIHVDADAELTRLAPDDILVAGNEVQDDTLTDLGAYTSGSVTRESGADRYAVCVAVSAAKFSPGVPFAVTAHGSSRADWALAAAIAAQNGSPLILTGTTLRPDVQAELTRLNPDDIIIVGAGTPTTVETALAAYTSGSVTRYKGTNVYGDSVAVSVAFFSPGVDVVYICPGWPTELTLLGDGPLAAAASAVVNGPILYVSATAIPSNVAAELTRLNPSDIIIVGGQVSAGVETALAGYTGGSVTRYVGDNVYETAAALSAAIYSSGQAVTWVADAFTLANAAAAAAAAGLDQASLIIVATGSSAFISPIVVNGTLTNRGDYPVQLDMILRVTGQGTITVEVGDSTFTLTVEESTGERIYRVKGEDKVLTVEEGGVEELRQDLITFLGDTTWPLIPPGTSPYSLTFAGVSIVGV